tara:strand:- start:52 stop:294 length:243 start_codon:yes stop_codon:yes gene_type:complete
MKNYLVWYRIKGESEDRIRGAAKNYTRAEQMAKNLAFYLKVDKTNVEAVGVKSGIHGTLYLNQDFHMRWSVVPPEEEKEE